MSTSRLSDGALKNHKEKVVKRQVHKHNSADDLTGDQQHLCYKVASPKSVLRFGSQHTKSNLLVFTTEDLLLNHSVGCTQPCPEALGVFENEMSFEGLKGW